MSRSPADKWRVHELRQYEHIGEFVDDIDVLADLLEKVLSFEGFFEY